MKKGKKLFVGLALLLSLGAVSLSSCSLFAEEGYQIIGIETIHDEVGGYTVVRITTNSEDEENKVITFTISDGITGNGIDSITGVPSSDGKSVIVTITYTDPNVPDTVFTIPVISGVDGRGIVGVETSTNQSGNIVVTFTYSDNTTSSFEIPKGIDGKDGNGIDSLVIDKTSKPGYTVIIVYFTDPNTPPYEIEIPNGEDGVGIEKIEKNETKSTSTVAIYTVYLSDGTSYEIEIPIPQATTWLHGVDTPRDSIGKEGDYYLNTTTGVVYVKYSGKWVEIFSMRGNGSAIDFDVTFNPYDGTWSNGTNTSLVFTNIEYGTYIDLDDIPVPVRTGYVFNGWYTTPSDHEYAVNSGQFTDLTPVLKDMELYPRWIIK